MRIVLASITGVAITILVHLIVLFLGTVLQLFTAPKPDFSPEGFEQIYQPLQFRDYLVPLFAHLVGLLAGLSTARTIIKTSSIPIFVVAGVYLISTAYNLYERPYPTWFAVTVVFTPILLTYLFINKVKTS